MTWWMWLILVIAIMLLVIWALCRAARLGDEILDGQRLEHGLMERDRVEGGEQ